MVNKPNIVIKYGGKAESKGWGTDLTTDYVLFNSVYTTYGVLGDGF